MTGSRIAVAVALAVGTFGLCAPASSVAAGNQRAWSYHVATATGSVAWRYSAANGGGLDSVIFHGTAGGASGALHGRATYTDQTWQGCGPITRTKTRSFRQPSFSVQGTNVVVTLRVPLPNPSYCGGARASAVTNPLRGMVFSQTIPLARFNCLTMSLRLAGRAMIPQTAITGMLVYQITVVIKRPPPTIAVSL